MAIAVPPVETPTLSAALTSGPVFVQQAPRRRWTAREFEQMSNAGMFGPEEHLELIEGEILVKVTQNPPHWTALRKTARILEQVFSTGHDVRAQAPLDFGEGAGNRPEPDVAVVQGSIEDFATHHPTTAVLVVEVSDTTLAFDQTVKAGVYARAGIPEYWIVNLTDRVLEVYRQPGTSATSPTGSDYGSRMRYTGEQAVAPLAASASSVSVADLLP